MIGFNPCFWHIKPFAYKKPFYADEWLVDPNLTEYRLGFLMFKVYILIESEAKEECLYD